MTVTEAIREFRAAAIAKADCAIPAAKDHALHARMVWAFNELVVQAAPEGTAAFRSLLQDESPNVRSWVAAQLLSQGDVSAIPIMEQLAAESGLTGLTAATTLKEFYAGRLRSPFTNSAD